jgi:hypothetical protein
MDVLVFSSYLIQIGHPRLKFETAYFHLGLLWFLEFELNRTRLNPSSHKDFEGYFTVSPKMFKIFCWKIRLEYWKTWSYCAMNFNFIEWKQSLVYIKIFRVFCYFLLKCLTYLNEIASWRISVIALMVVLILSQLD